MPLILTNPSWLLYSPSNPHLDLHPNCHLLEKESETKENLCSWLRAYIIGKSLNTTRAPCSYPSL